MTKSQKKLCNFLQEGLPICPQPFAEVARLLNSDEKKVLREIEQLKSEGVIKRISALINHRAIGRVGTLVAAHVLEENLPEVGHVVNCLEGVSHNYLRGHYYNLWFTLQGESLREIEITLSDLSADFGVDFHSLPVKRFFKLDTRFDAEGGCLFNGDVECTGGTVAVELNEDQRKILSGLQSDLELVPEPFDFLCEQDSGSREVVRILQELAGLGVVRRIAAVVDHRRLGFAANVLFCSRVGEDRIAEAGKALARFGMVSHCYERQTFEDWPCNLYAMMHGRSMGQIQHTVNRFVEAESIDLFELLPTIQELKKEPVSYRF